MICLRGIALQSIFRPIAFLVNQVRRRGVLGFFKAIVNYCSSKYYAWVDSSFDRRYGTDTQGIIDNMENLGVDSVVGALAKGYEGIQIPVFRKLLKDLSIDTESYSFIDFGSGKGRALMMAAEKGFSQVFGVEFSPVLYETAEKNIKIFERFNNDFSPIKIDLQDAAEYPIPGGNLVCFFYNPFDFPILERVINNLKESYIKEPREIIIAYRNPVYADAMANIDFLNLTMATCDYRIYKISHPS